MVADLEKCPYAHRQVDEQPTKRSKKNDDKSAVAMLKQNDLHESIRQFVVNRDKSHNRKGQHAVNRDTLVSQTTDLFSADHRMHDNWVVYFKT